MTNVLKRVSPVLAAILFFSASLFAQDQNTTTQQQDAGQQDNTQLQSSATELVENLATKITLNDEQKKEISDAVVHYQAATLNSSNQSGAATGGTSEATQGTEGSTGTEGTTGTEGATGTEGSTGTDQQGTSDMGEQSGSVSGTSAYTEEWLNSEIESILDDTQKTQWETVKADFWNQLRDKVATMQQNGMY